LDGVHPNWLEGFFVCLKKMRQKYDANWAGVYNLGRYLGVFCFVLVFVLILGLTKGFYSLITCLKKNESLFYGGAVE
jgi:hypothetical protein